ncbi:hypothetical protein [Comamonas brasiliensis]|uniref:hypothetical protein n=1 Tax=Comamonas brasiliensis TaxID=1812482 RepID=UPI0020166C46|nr:hypothetical protein [Comamonas sp. PE63]
MTSTADSHPTLLRTPGRYGFSNERILPGKASDYITEKEHQGLLLVFTSEGALSISDQAHQASNVRQHPFERRKQGCNRPVADIPVLNHAPYRTAEMHLS